MDLDKNSGYEGKTWTWISGCRHTEESGVHTWTWDISNVPLPGFIAWARIEVGEEKEEEDAPK